MLSLSKQYAGTSVLATLIAAQVLFASPEKYWRAEGANNDYRKPQPRTVRSIVVFSTVIPHSYRREAEPPSLKEHICTRCGFSVKVCGIESATTRGSHESKTKTKYFG